MSEQRKETTQEEMSEKERDSRDKIEGLVRKSICALGLGDGLVERVMAALPSREEMLPALHSSLRTAYGLTATVFAIGAWKLDLPAWFGVSETAGRIALGAIFFQAAVGAVALGVTLIRETGPTAAKALRSIFEGQKARTLAATAGAIVLLVAVWAFVGWFPADFASGGLRAARGSLAALVFVFLAVAAVQLWIIARGRDWRSALRLVEAAGLVVAGLACAMNYVIFVA